MTTRLMRQMSAFEIGLGRYTVVAHGYERLGVELDYLTTRWMLPRQVGLDKPLLLGTYANFEIVLL